MSWQRVEPPTEMEMAKKLRLLVDESFGQEAADYIKGNGYNVVFAKDVGLAGKSDEDVFAYAWREERVIWTHDKDFLDDTRFPENRNPGIVVMSGGRGDSAAMAVGLYVARLAFGLGGSSSWSKTKSSISPEGEITIRRRNLENGRIDAKRYRLRRAAVEQWES